jgi:hypothetical protein
MVSPGLAWHFFGTFLAAAGHAAVLEESSWSARSRVAARTNELDADERRTIMDSEEGFLSCWLMRGPCLSRAWPGGVVSQAPIRRRAGMLADAMTMCPGPGCSVK